MIILVILMNLCVGVLLYALKETPRRVYFLLFIDFLFGVAFLSDMMGVVYATLTSFIFASITFCAWWLMFALRTRRDSKQ